MLLPKPIAPPYFLALFIVSTTLHARPCFYCIILLSALFLTSCYWPPVPIETALSTPWADNITTYADALLSLMPELSPEMLPTTIPIVEHCWCDSASGKLFEPFNITRWELASVRKLRDTLRADMKEIARNQSSLLPDDPTSLHSESDLVNSTSLQNGSNSTTSLPVKENSTSTWSISWGNVWSFFSNPPNDTSGFTTNMTSSPTPTLPLPEPTRALPSSPPKAQGLFRREYDLKPLGFDLIFDFGWSTKGARS